MGRVAATGGAARHHPVRRRGQRRIGIPSPPGARRDVLAPALRAALGVTDPARPARACARFARASSVAGPRAVRVVVTTVLVGGSGGAVRSISSTTVPAAALVSASLSMAPCLVTVSPCAATMSDTCPSWADDGRVEAARGGDDASVEEHAPCRWRQRWNRHRHGRRCSRHRRCRQRRCGCRWRWSSCSNSVSIERQGIWASRFAAGLSAPIALCAISTAIPDASASVRSLRAIAWPAARYAHRRVPGRRPGAFAERRDGTSTHASSRRRCAPTSSAPRLARPRRLRRRRASRRPVAAARPASPMSASPSTGARTAPCSRVRTSADSAAGATAHVPSTTPCSTRCTPARSSAAVAPMSRCRRRRFPELQCSRFGRPDRPGRPRFSHPTHR